MLVLLVLVILLLCVLPFYPYLSAVVAKHRMLRRLRRVCGECGYRYRPLRRHPALALHGGEGYELVVESKTRVLTIKLHSAYRRGTVLVLREDGSVLERQDAPLLMDVRRGARASRIERRERRLRPIPLPTSPKETRPVTGFLLVYPSYREVLRQRGDREERLTGGDRVLGMRLISPSALEALLRQTGEGSGISREKGDPEENA